jgi:DinB superfamily
MTHDAALGTPLHADLVEMLEATRAAERAIFDLMDSATRDAPRTIGEWSAKDLLAHLAAWREVEAERLRTGWHDRQPADPGDAAGDGDAGGESDDVANARIQAERETWSWDRVAANAEASIDALEAAIAGTSAEMLERSENLVAGIGANGANHALAHLSDAAGAAGPVAAGAFQVFESTIEAIIVRGRIPDRDVGVMLYNLGCNAALTNRPDEARRLVRDALRRRPDLLDWALQDGDLQTIRAELPVLAGG